MTNEKMQPPESGPIENPLDVLSELSQFKPELLALVRAQRQKVLEEKRLEEKKLQEDEGSRKSRFEAKIKEELDRLDKEKREFAQGEWKKFDETNQLIRDLKRDFDGTVATWKGVWEGLRNMIKILCSIPNRNQEEEALIGKIVDLMPKPAPSRPCSHSH